MLRCAVLQCLRVIVGGQICDCAAVCAYETADLDAFRELGVAGPAPVTDFAAPVVNIIPRPFLPTRTPALQVEHLSNMLDSLTGSLTSGT